MPDIPYKIQVKIGPSEFSAEGSEEKVTKAYDAFLKAIVQVGAFGAAPPRHSAYMTPATDTTQTPLVLAVDAARMDKVFKREGEIVSLRHLPTTATRIADAAILLIYGYMKLCSLDEVPIIRLNEGLRESGLNFDRLDRHIGVHQALFRKGGQKSGARYTLNNQGMKQAEEWLKAWD